MKKRRFERLPRFLRTANWGHATTFGYDALGRRTTVTDALGHTTTTEYDLLLLPPLSQPPERAVGPRISFVAVLATPSAYDGKRVTVEGWCFRGQEESALYLSRDDVDFLNTSSAFWLEMDAKTLPELKPDTSLRCSVEGRVDTKKHGHLEMYPATLTGISHASRMKARAEYDRLSR